MAKAAAVLAKAVGAVHTESATDRELLRRFADDGDQPAFAALTARHAAMVFGVCQRVLHSRADAEDASQAVFLILAKKAGNTRWQASAANWLYATARKVARNARVAASRRARREGAAAVAEAVPPADTLTGPELLAALDEELERLPPRYREPLVLCYLEGLTRDEAAARLGVPAATLKSQLERGRKKLADALTARGCALGVALLLTATSSAGASPPRPLESVLAAVCGKPSPAAVALAQGVVMGGTVTRMKLAILAALGAAALGLGTASEPVAAGTQVPAAKTVEPPEKPMPPEQPGRKFGGAVYDLDNKPVRAELIFVPTGGDARVVGTTDAKGEFAVTLPTKPFVVGELLARADGYGVAGLTVWRDTPDELRFFVAPECVIRGRVIDQQGKPVVGATLSPLQFTAAAPERTDYFLKVWARMAPQETAFNQMREFEDTTFRTDPRLNLPDGRKLLSATTDADGRFALAGFGKEQVVEVLVRGPGLAETHALVVTRAGFDPDPVNRATVEERKKFLLAPNGPIASPVRLFGPTPTFVMEPEKPIRGTVTDDAGKPRAGVRVEFRRLGEKGFLTLRPHTATTDKDGRFVIRGSQRYATYLIETDADPKTGFKAGRVLATDTPGLEAIEVTVRTPR
jgi:RNA polymerase sigma factor (sigma-70 family)